MTRIILFSILIWLFSSSLIAQNALQSQIFNARDRVMPALVHVEPVIQIFTRGEKQHTVVTGSGVIFSKEGYVLTNHHVAANATKVWCTLSTKERITATVVGSDPSTDIAVLKLNLEELENEEIPFAELGNSDSLEVGQIVLALGSPLGLSRSVSMGVVSSIDRYFPNRGSMVSPYNLWIQTDAAINPGNSGGPLINLFGDVIGINARAVFFAENLGFAIPVNLVREVAEEIIEGSSVKRAWIGLEFQQIKDLKEYLGKDDFHGVLVSHVTENSPAEKAGIKSGDVIQHIGKEKINVVYEEDLPTLRKIIAALPVGKKTGWKIWRNQKSMDVKVSAIEEPFKDDPEYEASEWGLVVKGLSWHIFQMQSLPDYNGVYVSSVKPSGPADESSIRNGDVIRKINDKVVTSDQEFKSLYETLIAKDGGLIYLELVRNGHPYFAVIKPGAGS